MRRSQAFLAVLMAAVAGLAAGLLLPLVRTARAGPVPSSPTIEQVRRLASLVTLHVVVSDVQVRTIHGYTGGVSLVLIVHGGVEVTSDLAAASLQQVDPLHKQAVLVLPPPEAVRPRLDHEHTRIYRIERTGLWRILPGQAGEAELANRALQQAQQVVEQAGGHPRLAAQARRHAEHVLAGFFEALGWRVRIEWQDAAPPPAASRPRASGALPLAVSRGRRTAVPVAALSDPARPRPRRTCTASRRPWLWRRAAALGAA